MAEEKDPLVSVTPKVETTEVLDQHGNTLKSSVSLGSIFDKIESGKPAEEAIKEVMDAPEKKVEEDPLKQTEVKEEVKEEKKDEPKTLDSALDKQEQKQEVKTEVKVETKPEDVVPEEELQVLPHDKPKTAKRISALLEKAKKLDELVATTRKEAEEKQSKLTALEQELSKAKSADPATNDAIKQQMEELAMLRRQYELDKDPEVKTRFDSKLDSSEKTIEETLTKQGASTELLSIIKEEGGWNKFCDSNRPIQLKEGSIPARDVAEKIMASIPYTARKNIDSAMIEQSQTVRDRQRFFEEQRKTATDYFKKREEAALNENKTYQQRVQEARDGLEKWRSELLTKNDWLQEKQISANATKEQKAELEDHNKAAAEYKSEIEKTIAGTGMDHVLKIAEAAVRYKKAERDLARQDAIIKAKDARIKELEGRVDQFKSGGRSVPRSGSIASGSTTMTEKKKGPPVGLEAALDAIESGELVDAQQ